MKNLAVKILLILFCIFILSLFTHFYIDDIDGRVLLMSNGFSNSSYYYLRDFTWDCLIWYIWIISIYCIAVFVLGVNDIFNKEKRKEAILKILISIIIFILMTPGLLIAIFDVIFSMAL